MIKAQVFIIVATALLIDGTPGLASVLEEAARNGNWEPFRTLISQGYPGDTWPSILNANVESLKPIDGAHVYGHSVSSYSSWSDDGQGNVSQDGKGVEIINKDGDVTRREFKP